MRAFHVSESFVQRACKKAETEGEAGFFSKDNRKGSSHVIVESLRQRLQELLDKGISVNAMAKQYTLNESTIRYQIKQGYLKKKIVEQTSAIISEQAIGLKERSQADQHAPLGIGTTRYTERAAAAKGLPGGAFPQFANQESVLYGGVLYLLPALIQQGLFKAAEVYTGIKEGYYRVESIVLTLAIMALCRIKNPEQTKQCKPGELGKVIGLDRIPEVRCLRKKVKELSDQNQSVQIGKELFRHWMPEDLDSIYLYVDGHVRIYHGSQANLPSKYVSRQKLCLSGTTEFWVNDANGSPLMVVTGELTEKLQQVIQEQIIPQVAATGVLPAAPAGHPIYTVIFDREAYSIPCSNRFLNSR